MRSRAKPGSKSPARQTTLEQVASGEDVVMGDAVSTRTKSRLQIMLLDQTAITMGENASLVIDEFVYDPENAGSALSASVTQGAFRLVTGGVARNNPEGTKVKLPSAVLTIRGTTTEGNCNSTGCIVVLSDYRRPEFRRQEAEPRCLINPTRAAKC